MINVTLSVLKLNKTLIIVSAVQFDVSHGTDGAGGNFSCRNKAKK